MVGKLVSSVADSFVDPAALSFSRFAEVVSFLAQKSTILFFRTNNLVLKSQRVLWNRSKMLLKVFPDASSPPLPDQPKKKKKKRKKKL